MDKVGILGGTFNPPHLGHLIIANEVMCSQGLDEVWFMPNQEPPHKEKSNAASNRDRIEMLKLAVDTHPGFKLELIELERQGPSFTYDTIKILKENYPQKQFYFIIGADMVEYLPKWHNIDKLLEMITFVGVQRPSYNLETSYSILYSEVPEMGISSSMIRSRLKKGGSIRYLVPDSIGNYIKENHLYES
ncbi:nicotinate-nucleotide adenylyltransferase [Bacillus sp. ISL-47]|uniref:nicotinate-nucleotide adenylyltransferase n=1 Tax=Bacillus sp. ISL-47 TaxID=2819130 RepID=UPI001BE67555|nr:nicotinate-nucleotide adenylyltransferase [Bacillus sp. ISL-47]MBT2690298.1 nicotinate-nucleotide adenylyltransferase [Bacillus sp. ISL-47]MBT2707997.1 nicotinate-nucleotide adenylyltransferase [Pseudomonas sp. ISL-84]